MLTPSLIHQVTVAVASAVNDVKFQMANHEVDQEPQVTDRLAQALRTMLNRVQLGSIRISVRTLGDRGPNSAESRFGADLCCVLRIDIPGYKVCKGFLAQAKRPGRYEFRSGVGVFGELDDVIVGLRNDCLLLKNDKEFRRSVQQCQDMLHVTPASFQFVYTPEGFYAVSAVSVAGIQEDTGIALLDCKTLPAFFADFFRCFIGDPDLTGWTDIDLSLLRERTQARRWLLIDVTTQNPLPTDSRP